MGRRSVVMLGAAALGLVVFGAALLLTARPDIFRGLASGPQCRAAAQMAEAVEPFAKGGMAAFVPMTPTDLSALPYSGGDEDAATLADLKGRTILLNLWATWCAPCRVEMPSLAALQTAEGSEDFEVVAVSIDNRDDADPAGFLKEAGATALAFHHEPSMRLFNSLKTAGLVAGMPTTFLIAPDGCAAGSLAGAADWEGKDARALVQAAVASTR